MKTLLQMQWLESTVQNRCGQNVHRASWKHLHHDGIQTAERRQVAWRKDYSGDVCTSFCWGIKYWNVNLKGETEHSFLLWTSTVNPHIQLQLFLLVLYKLSTSQILKTCCIQRSPGVLILLQNGVSGGPRYVLCSKGEQLFPAWPAIWHMMGKMKLFH